MNVLLDLLHVSLLDALLLFLIYFALIDESVQVKLFEHLLVVHKLQMFEVAIRNKIEPKIKHYAELDQAICLFFCPAAARL